MNIYTINSTSLLSRCMRYIGIPLFAGLVAALMIPATTLSQTVYSNPATVDLLTAGNFRILAGTAVTISTGTTVTGDVGVSPGSTITNNGTVNGTIHLNTAAAVQAQLDLTAAYDNAAGRTVNETVGTELGGTTLGRGVYTAASGTFGITGTLTLSGTASDIFIFKMASTLTTGASSSVTFTGGALASNVFWQVGSSATIDGNFKGIILALTAITQNTGTSSIDGRLLTRNSFVTVGGTSVLPVELTSFTAALNNRAVELNWNTATEVNNYGFEVQRLAVSNQLLANSKELNANNWNKIGFVQGHGNSNSPKEYSFVDKNLQVGKLQYRLKQIDFDGAFEYSDVVEVEVGAPKQFAVYQNYPNPFNPTTNISYEIPVKSNVVIKVYDVLGSEVADLLNEEKLPGRYQVEFNAPHLPSGIYFYSINAGKYKSIKKMILLK